MGKAVGIRHCAATVLRGSFRLSALSRKASLRGSQNPAGDAPAHQAPNMNTNRPAPPGGTPRVVLALALAGCLSYAQAAEAVAITHDPLPEVELATVTVSAYGGTAVPYDRTGVSVTVLDVAELKEEGIDTLNEALSSVPGVSVQPDGLNQRGNVGNIALRGMSSGQYTLPMMDGMRLYSFSGGANITPNVVGRTDLFSLGTLEVLRGAQGAVCGAGAIGGVIYMETPEGQGEPSLTLFNEAGSFDSYTGSAVAQGRVEDLAFYLSTTYERTNNDIAYADGQPVPRKHAGHYGSWNEALRLDYDLNPDNKLTFTYRREDAGYTYVSPSYGGYITPSDYSFRSNLVTAKWQSKVSEAYSTSVMAGYYGLDNMLGHGYNLNLRNAQFEWRNMYRWNERHSTTAGLAWNRSDYRCLSANAGSDKDDTLDNTYGFFFEHLYTPAKNWDNSLALRWDRSSVWDGQASFRAATNYRFNGETTRAFASVGSGYKTPSALQRSGVASFVGYRGPELYIGNPDLDCEHNLTVDAGLEQQWAEGHSLSATLFWSRIEDGIVDDYSHVDYTTFRNATGHWTSQGIELAAYGTWKGAWKTGYRLAFTYTQPKDEDDRQLAHTARQVWSADIHTSPIEGFTTGLGLTATVGRTGGPAGLRLDDYYSLRWYARYEWSERLSFHLRVENLTNQKFISEYAYGMSDQGGAIISAGTAVYGGCTLKF